MNNKTQFILTSIISSMALSACSQQPAAPEIPAVVVNPPKVVQVTPKPYQEVIVKPAPLKPAPMPKPVVRPAPIVKPVPVPVVAMPAPVVTVPAVKAKGTYRGAVPIDNTLRQQYQQ